MVHQKEHHAHPAGLMHSQRRRVSKHLQSTGAQNEPESGHMQNVRTSSISWTSSDEKKKKKEITDHANPEGNGPQRSKERGRRMKMSSTQQRYIPTLYRRASKGSGKMVGPDDTRIPDCTPSNTGPPYAPASTEPRVTPIVRPVAISLRPRK